MSFQPGGNVYTQGFGSRPENVEVPHLDVRAPTSSDVLYPRGKRWVDYVGNNEYCLTSFSTSAGVTSANWVLTSSGGTSGVVPVSKGGTGDTSLTAHGVLIGEGTSPVAVTAVGTTGQVLIGSTGADPAFGALGLNSGLTAHGVLLGQGNSAISALAVASTGQTLMGATGADPAFTGSPSFSGSVTAATTITATLGAITASNGNVVLATAGNKLVIATGANASVGTSSAMIAGAVTVATTACSATAQVNYCRNVLGGTAGNVSITAQDGTGFTLTSSSNTETSTFNWWIINA